MVKLVIASHNPKKIAELRTLVQGSGLDMSAGDIVSASDLGVAEPVEDGATFEENASIKARAIFEQTGYAALADDSGLIVNILMGAPGVLSARWSGKHGDDKANNQLLLNQLEGLPDVLRKAHFVTTCALVWRDSSGSVKEAVVHGKMHGEIIREARGDKGFGYDAIFVPSAYAGSDLEGLTSAELTPDQKNSISHRAKALQKILPHIGTIRYAYST
ncbi:MAG: RdgB/HAM1 family non-canonical purine NTP pyrophosphatase [Candidatus Ancillula sp.]|jgi:XTP/dITP diphosphohydrolase|nr:RdgB/HAM1 family non-canonical purine NTP pyrophosphatase [Candidatus Ancillula sp.]